MLRKSCLLYPGIQSVAASPNNSLFWYDDICEISFHQVPDISRSVEDREKQKIWYANVDHSLWERQPEEEYVIKNNCENKSLSIVLRLLKEKSQTANVKAND